MSFKTRLATFAGTAALACVVGFAAGAAHAERITDPRGDLLPTFGGPPDAADLDVRSAFVTYGDDAIRLHATMFGDIGTTAGGLYVWGIDRGGADDILNAGPTPVGAGVNFNAFLDIRPFGESAVVLIDSTGFHRTVLGAGAVSFSGRTLNVTIDRAALPSTGADFAEFGYNIWPRIHDITDNHQVADFAPDHRTFTADAAPEPATWALMIAGFGLAGATVRRHRRATA